MDVEPASRLFSTSSFTAVCRSTTTWPEEILCTEAGSRALMESRAEWDVEAKGAAIGCVTAEGEGSAAERYPSNRQADS